jgi:hypothetical protein
MTAPDVAMTTVRERLRFTGDAAAIRSHHQKRIQRDAAREDLTQCLNKCPALCASGKGARKQHL